MTLQDGGGLNSTTDLIINVKDVQDTPPYFINLPYSTSIREDVPVVCILNFLCGGVMAIV